MARYPARKTMKKVLRQEFQMKFSENTDLLVKVVICHFVRQVVTDAAAAARADKSTKIKKVHMTDAIDRQLRILK